MDSNILKPADKMDMDDVLDEFELGGPLDREVIQRILF